MQNPLIEMPEESEPKTIEIGTGTARVLKAERQQIEMRVAALDSMIGEEHKVRIIWAMVQGYDLSGFYGRIAALEGGAGRPAIDPAILVALWLYATSEGVGSARALERLCEEHIAYQWIAGGVKVNYHTLADFRVMCEKELDDLLSQSVAALMSEGLVSLERTAQDGVRVRASAGTSSFRRQGRLEQFLTQAQERVVQLKEEGHAEREALSKQAQAGRERAARERVERVQKALEEIQKINESKVKNHKKKSEQKEARSSTSDPEARVMKMGDGGFRPAYNGEFGVDVQSGIVVAVTATNRVDQGQMEPLLAQIEVRYQRNPQEHLVDGGFVTVQDLEAAYRRQVKVYAPVPEPQAPGLSPVCAPEEAGPGVRTWWERMQTEAAKTIYPQRAASSEWVNAQARNRGLQQLRVRGMQKVKSVLLWFALVHNLWVSHRLHATPAVAMA
jgi:transposase